MNININSVHFKADKDLEQFIVKKIERIGKLHEGIFGSEVTLKLDNTDKPENKIAEIRLKLKGNDLLASKQCKTFEEATDQAIDALKRQIGKSKDFPKPDKGKLTEA
ncbi:MAG: ribosome-associated translation inhibitor RaiA [Bacteroidales bacterium]|jgi:putative sigma-54 modulation protein|nr:ribosome-associated translation inhibitor RaiA [Bacteroidales bacterium]MBQ2488698.1 ribosome-associated translation inhibitor RaiA [Bacteroidales bacterium]MBQ5532493.1 ribosome-associated translation inhibitor RaiA [Bacteroidales bacterium]MBQ6666671.1 ribosome-associated translation inhibitor RaiA [Bacteroidales bacterium]MBR4491257.1 ribosome-associated translation inhibitor RaiA [Bacteroidales bacterium]